MERGNKDLDSRFFIDGCVTVGESLNSAPVSGFEVRVVHLMISEKMPLPVLLATGDFLDLGHPFSHFVDVKLSLSCGRGS